MRDARAFYRTPQDAVERRGIGGVGMGEVELRAGIGRIRGSGVGGTGVIGAPCPPIAIP